MIENLLERSRSSMLHTILFSSWYSTSIVTITSFKSRFSDTSLLQDENEIKYTCYKNGLAEIKEC